MEILFGKTFGLLSTMLDFRSERHKLISSNITNIDTPGYIPKDLIFKKELYEAMEKRVGEVSLLKTHPKHLGPIPKPSDRYFEITPTGQKVILDREMINLTENQLMQNLSVDLMARKFRGLNSVLTEAK